MPSKTMKVGDRVKVIRGAYKGQTGVVYRLTKMDALVDLDSGVDGAKISVWDLWRMP